MAEWDCHESIMLWGGGACNAHPPNLSVDILVATKFRKKSSGRFSRSYSSLPGSQGYISGMKAPVSEYSRVALLLAPL